MADTFRSMKILTAMINYFGLPDDGRDSTSGNDAGANNGQLQHEYSCSDSMQSSLITLGFNDHSV